MDPNQPPGPCTRIPKQEPAQEPAQADEETVSFQWPYFPNPNHATCPLDFPPSDSQIKNPESILKKLICRTTTDVKLDTDIILSTRKTNPETLGKSLADFRQANIFSQPLESFDSLKLPWISSGFSGLEFLDMFCQIIKKNRSYQEFIQSKLIEIKTRLDQNKTLKERLRILKDSKLTKQGSFLKRDANSELVSVQSTGFQSSKVPALFYGPLENAHVANYKMVLMEYRVLLHRHKWSKEDDQNLRKGIEQHLQEILSQNSGSDKSSGSSNAFENVTDVEITPQDVRSSLPKIDWQWVASMYVSGRSAAECQARWLNSGDPLVSLTPWTKAEDKKLLLIIQNRGVHNWIEVANTLGTNRNPFQCLARYQRSLNSQIIKQEWTAEDDAQLIKTVETFGTHDWSYIASKLERRVGSQCSYRWNYTLDPAKERVGRWTVEEDRYLKVAVMLFGPKSWQKIAQFIPGRTQVQCRERWVNVLDPSINMRPWTEEEDSKLKAAIAKHGHCWSKVAAFVGPRTDNQCRRRWKVLLPQELPLLQAERRIRKSKLISNFVAREDERPALVPSDFLLLPGMDAVPEAEKGNNVQEKKRITHLRGHCKTKKQRQEANPKTLPHQVTAEKSPTKAIFERSPTKAKNVSKAASRMIGANSVEPFGWDDSVLEVKKAIKLQLKRKRCTDSAKGLQEDLTSPERAKFSQMNGACTK